MFYLASSLLSMFSDVFMSFLPNCLCSVFLFNCAHLVSLSNCAISSDLAHPLIYQGKLNNIQEIYPNYQHIYTDGSKSNFGTGCGAIHLKKSLEKCLPKEASIFSAEIYAINLALDLISTSSSKKFIIHSDSISVLQSLKYTKLENPLIVKIFNKLNSLIHSKTVIFC